MRRPYRLGGAFHCLDARLRRPGPGEAVDAEVGERRVQSCQCFSSAITSPPTCREARLEANEAAEPEGVEDQGWS